MLRTYILEELCCANCAAKIEKKVASLDGVENVNVNFLTTKLTLETADGAEGLTEQIRKIVRRQDPDIVLREVTR